MENLKQENNYEKFKQDVQIATNVLQLINRLAVY